MELITRNFVLRKTAGARHVKSGREINPHTHTHTHTHTHALYELQLEKWPHCETLWLYPTNLTQAQNLNLVTSHK
jgi:hypothetical protein